MRLLIGTRGGVFDHGGRRLDDGDRVHHVVGEPGGWWAATVRGLVRNGDLVAPTPGGAVLNCVAVTGDGVLVGADRARLFRLEGDSLVEDRDFATAPGRDQWHTPWGGPPDVRSLAEGPDGVLYINVHVGGILRGEGGRYRPTLDIDADVHQVVAHPGRPGTVLAACARGLARSDDGNRFEFVTRGLAHHYCRAVAVAGDTVVISASRGPGGGDARLHRGSLAGGELEPIGSPGPLTGNIDTHCLVAGADGYYMGNGSRVWGSADRGTTWQEVRGDLPEVTCLAALEGV